MNEYIEFFFVPYELQTPDFTQTPCEIQKLKRKNKQKHFSPNFVLWTLQEEFGLYNQW